MRVYLEMRGSTDASDINYDTVDITDDLTEGSLDIFRKFVGGQGLFEFEASDPEITLLNWGNKYYTRAEGETAQYPILGSIIPDEGTEEDWRMERVVILSETGLVRFIGFVFASSSPIKYDDELDTLSFTVYDPLYLFKLLMAGLPSNTEFTPEGNVAKRARYIKQIQEEDENRYTYILDESDWDDLTEEEQISWEKTYLFDTFAGLIHEANSPNYTRVTVPGKDFEAWRRNSDANPITAHLVTGVVDRLIAIFNAWCPWVTLSRASAASDVGSINRFLLTDIYYDETQITYRTNNNGDTVCSFCWVPKEIDSEDRLYFVNINPITTRPTDGVATQEEWEEWIDANFKRVQVGRILNLLTPHQLLLNDYQEFPFLGRGGAWLTAFQNWYGYEENQGWHGFTLASPPHVIDYWYDMHAGIFASVEAEGDECFVIWRCRTTQVRDISVEYLDSDGILHATPYFNMTQFYIQAKVVNLVTGVLIEEINQSQWEQGNSHVGGMRILEGLNIEVIPYVWGEPVENESDFLLRSSGTGLNYDSNQYGDTWPFDQRYYVLDGKLYFAGDIDLVYASLDYKNKTMANILMDVCKLTNSVLRVVPQDSTIAPLNDSLKVGLRLSLIMARRTYSIDTLSLKGQDIVDKEHKRFNLLEQELPNVSTGIIENSAYNKAMAEFYGETYFPTEVDEYVISFVKDVLEGLAYDLFWELEIDNESFGIIQKISETENVVEFTTRVYSLTGDM